jgi:hypothetical protein
MALPNLQKVIESKKDYVTSYYGANRATVVLEWICTLACGHVERRRRPTEPEKLKCSRCHPSKDWRSKDDN